MISRWNALLLAEVLWVVAKLAGHPSRPEDLVFTILRPGAKGLLRPGAKGLWCKSENLATFFATFYLNLNWTRLGETQYF